MPFLCLPLTFSTAATFSVQGSVAVSDHNAVLTGCTWKTVSSIGSQF